MQTEKIAPDALIRFRGKLRHSNVDGEIRITVERERLTQSMTY